MHFDPAPKSRRRRDIILVAVFAIAALGLLLMPTDYDQRLPPNSLRCKGVVIEVDDSEIQQFGLIRQGEQYLTLRLASGPFEGEIVQGENRLMGRMDIDKVFKSGDEVLTVLSLTEDGEISNVNPQDIYRLDLELLLLGLFVVLLLAYGGWTGAKAILSFAFAGLIIWKVLVPGLLDGYDPVWLTLGLVTLLCGAIIFLVAGPTRRGLVAFLGAFLGVLTSCALALYFTDAFHLHGAVMPFAETLLYSGYAHLDLVRIYVAAVFLAASGAVMDLAMDVAASQYEVVCAKPDMTRWQVVRSGFAVGRAVVGTMTTTLLLAYSGGFITLFMAFMAQGIPLANFFNMIYVAAEVLKTLVGSFGLVTVAPFTALMGGLLFVPRQRCEQDETSLFAAKAGSEID